MEDRIETDNLQDLLQIFDPQVQENDDTGDARILYTFKDEAPERRRVGETFILNIRNKNLEFFVTVPVTGAIDEGSIVLSHSQTGVKDRYSLSQKDLKQLITDIDLASGDGEEEINQLLDA